VAAHRAAAAAATVTAFGLSAAAFLPHAWVLESDGDDFDGPKPWVWLLAALKSCLDGDASASSASLRLQSARVASTAFSPLLVHDGALSGDHAYCVRYYDAQSHVVWLESLSVNFVA
jgi:hypothetical protein